jgi:hypothetical protein
MPPTNGSTLGPTPHAARSMTGPHIRRDIRDASSVRSVPQSEKLHRSEAASERLESFDADAGPLVRIEKELTRVIRRNTREQEKTRADAVWPVALHRLKIGHSTQAVADYVRLALGEYGETPAGVADLIAPLLELSRRLK